MKTKVFVIEDEPDILELIRLKLEDSGFYTRGFEHAELFFKQLITDFPDLILLDLMLPDMDGMEVCRRLKGNTATEKIPVIILTARTDIEDKVKGLEYGADDYITKPFEAKELVARVNAVLRRSSWESSKNVLSICAGFVIDFNRYEVQINNARADITLTEFKILQLLTKRPGWVYNRSQILDFLWGSDKVVIERTVDVHIRNLREKLGEYANMIQNIRGVGYRFSTSKEDQLG
ncbi:MAG: response regulator transcription factor [Candidatus Cloacimonas sp.]|jgi:two-component system phosphate regulon response regulator PhoB/two-component system alkaline phosphatase synthesis response regulator PhoP|nr:response regulator transcription factor [Candidatus Cloacimonas sp.]